MSPHVTPARRLTFLARLNRTNAPLLVALAFVLINLVGLDRSPVVWLDEVVLNDPAKEWALHGQLRSSVFADRPAFTEGYLWQPPGQVLVTAAAYKLFGFGIWQTRVPGVLFGAGALIAIYFITAELAHRKRACLFAVAIFALDPQFIQSARSGRMDAQTLFLALLAVWSYLRSEALSHRHSYWLTASGLLAGLAAITHPVAASWTITIGLLILVRSRGNRLQDLVVFGTAAALPPALWLAYALRTPDTFRAQFLSHGDAHLVGGSFAQRLAAELARYREAYHLAPALLLAYVAVILALVFLLQRSRLAKIRLLLLFGVPFLFNAFLMTKTVGFYFLHPVSALAICAGVAFDDLAPSPLALRSRNPRSLAVLGASGVLVMNLLASGLGARYLALLYQWQERDYRQVRIAVRDLIPAGSIVCGPPELWYAAEEAGVSLRVLSSPDPHMHDFAVVKLGYELPPGFAPLAAVGQPLPPVFGRIVLPSLDYRMRIGASELRSQPGRTSR